jgi:arylformamidase
MDWDDAYSNAAYIPQGNEYLTKWPREAARFRSNLPVDTVAYLNLPYGVHDRQEFDLFSPIANCKGLCVFVHGGYWLRFGKSDWSHLAAGALSRGWAVAMPGYRLCPDVSVTEIAKDVAEAIGVVAARFSGPLRLAGHSAGGHLVTRLVSRGTPLDAKVLARIERVVSISGLHDLHPLMKTSMNAILRITAEEAQRESPALLAPATRAPVTCWVGSDERPEFLYQNDLLVSAWGERGASIAGHHEAGRHHFDVIEDLCDVESGLCQVFTG